MGTNFAPRLDALADAGPRAVYDKAAFIRPRGPSVRADIGLEYEILAFDARTLAPFGHSAGALSFRGLFERLGRSAELAFDAVSGEPTAATLRGGSVVSVEPGGQIEIATPPLASAREAMHALARAVASVEDAAPELVFVGHGTNPLFGRQHPFFDGKYRYLVVGDACRGALELHASAASLQVNVDVPGDRADWDDAFRLAYDVEDVLAPAMENARFVRGSALATKISARRLLWAAEPRASFRPPAEAQSDVAYLEWALDQDCLFVSHALDAERRRGATSFRAWEAEGRPTADDFRIHLGLLWPVVRPRGFLEVRWIDAPDFADAAPIVVLMHRLLADRATRTRVRALLDEGRATPAGIALAASTGDAWEAAQLARLGRRSRRRHACRDPRAFLQAMAVARPSSILEP